MVMIKYFLDTTDLLKAFNGSDKYAVRLMDDSSKKKYTNEYAIKEYRRILKYNFQYPDDDIERAVEYIFNRCTILPSPPSNRFKKLKIQDKSDKPIVQGAIDSKCILVTSDNRTYRDSKAYVESVTAEEIYRKSRKR